MSQKSKWEYLKAIYTRYRKVSKELRALILNEFCQVCGFTANTLSVCSMAQRHKSPPHGTKHVPRATPPR